VDSYYLSRDFEKLFTVSSKPELATDGFSQFRNTSSRKVPDRNWGWDSVLSRSEDQFDLIYADPARRGDSNQKLYRLEDCQPNVVAAWELMKSKSNSILLKLSPMLTFSGTHRTSRNPESPNHLGEK